MTAVTETLTRTQAMARAREMHADGAWTFAEIARYLAARGQAVHQTTVRTWVDPAYKAQRLADGRELQRTLYRRQSGVLRAKRIDEEAVTTRLDQLIDAGLSANATATVIGLDMRLRITEYDVVSYRTDGKLTRKVLKQVVT